jgi:hypothetical protein
MSTKFDFIRLGEQLSEEENAAFDLWTWLPSHREATKYHGDYSIEHRPSTADVMREAASYLSSLKYNDFDKEEFKCSCDGEHPDINIEDVLDGIKEGQSVLEIAVEFEVEPHIIDNILDFHRQQQFSAASE